MAISTEATRLLRNREDIARTMSTHDPDAKMAQITREQWQHFLDTYRPVETEVLESAMSTDFSQQGDEAGQLVSQSLSAAAGTLSRNLRRTGTAVSADDRKALARRAELAKTRGVARAENTTRRTLSDSRTNILAQLVGVGRGVSQTASMGMNAAAGMQAQREALGIQHRAQAKNQNMSMAASAAMLLMMV